jgi:hypothetical protein
MLKSKSGQWALHGDASAQIVVCGHSHVASILKAAIIRESQAKSEPAISYCFGAYDETGPPQGDEYWDLVVNSSRGKHVVVVWNGNQHNSYFMFQTKPKFTVLGVTGDSYDNEPIPIPKSMVRQFFKPSFEELTGIIPSLSDAASITLLNGPAPKPLSYIKNYILQEKYFSDLTKLGGVSGEDLVITSDSLRLELWNVLAELLASYGKELGANFINAPEVSRDALGLLLPEYWYPDVTHANSKYGMLIIEELVKLKFSGEAPN